mmetsp:Transcript_90769/g.256312  ORF Transcript_90769/g.256312 Transcript_90769/m.256312 type:complete len:248 (+) Transcript_90769:203-946(+)
MPLLSAPCASFRLRPCSISSTSLSKGPSSSRSFADERSDRSEPLALLTSTLCSDLSPSLVRPRSAPLDSPKAPAAPLCLAARPTCCACLRPPRPSSKRLSTSSDSGATSRSVSAALTISASLPSLESASSLLSWPSGACLSFSASLSFLPASLVWPPLLVLPLSFLLSFSLLSAASVPDSPAFSSSPLVFAPSSPSLLEFSSSPPVFDPSFDVLLILPSWASASEVSLLSPLDRLPPPFRRLASLRR